MRSGLRALKEKEDAGGQSDAEGGGDPTTALVMLALKVSLGVFLLILLIVRLGWARRAMALIEKLQAKSDEVLAASQVR